MKEWLRILSIDGGGIRGLFSVLVLAEIERRTGHSICSLFDVITGCSSGSIITLGLALPDEPNAAPDQVTRLLRLFEEEGRTVFADSLLRRVSSLGGLTKPRYPRRPLEKVLKDYYGDATLADVATTVLIPCYALETRQLLLLTNADERYRSLRVHDVALAGSAAQVFFSPVQVTVEGRPLALIDAGLFAGNPAMLAYTFAVSVYANAANTVLVSVGVGYTSAPFQYRETRSWGAIQWIWPLLEITRDGHIELVDVEVNGLFASRQTRGTHRYFRCDHPLGTASARMDDVSEDNLAALREMAAAYIREQSHDLDTLCRLLLEAGTPEGQAG